MKMKVKIFILALIFIAINMAYFCGNPHQINNNNNTYEDNSQNIITEENIIPRDFL